MSKARPKPPKARKPKAAKADLPAVIPPRSPEEEALVAAWKGTPRHEHPPKFKREPDGKIGLMSADKVLANARLDRVFCGVDSDYTTHLVSLIASTLGIADHVHAGDVAVAMVHAIGPRDPVESILASQMVATNDVAMEMLRRARIPEQPSEIVDQCVLRATRLMRTFTAQVATLKDYRSKGHQTVTVQHVNVSEGGQAIVGGGVTLQKGTDAGGGGS
jgi:hypothetical protein